MARWRLINAHYLKVPGNEWEYKETDRTTGKQVRRVFEVPMLLDPNDPADCNYPGEIIVTDGRSSQPRDILFIGPPTPEMEPLNAEAEAISAEWGPKWRHPIDGEFQPGGGYTQSLLSGLERQVEELARGQRSAPVAIKGVDPADFAKLQEQMAALMAKNAELEARTSRRA